MIIFLYGPDTYRSREKLRALKQRFIRQVDKSGFNLVEMDGEKVSVDEFMNAVGTQSFLCSKRMVVVENLLTKSKKIKDKEAFLEYLKKGQFVDARDDINIIIFWEDGEPDKRTAMFKFLDSSRYKEKFVNLSNNQMAAWVKQRVKQKGGQIEEQAVGWLIGELGTDMWLVANELNKIISYCKGRAVTRQDVDTLIQGKLDNNIFNLTDAVAQKNKALALKLINGQLESGINQMYLFSMIVRQFRILLQIKDEIERGGGFINNYELAKNLSLHPFVVQKTLQQVAGYSLEQLKSIYEKLLEIDLKMKSTRLSPEVLLNLLVVSI